MVEIIIRLIINLLFEYYILTRSTFANVILYFITFVALMLILSFYSTGSGESDPTLREFQELLKKNFEGKLHN
jgi:uncharacterized membrane protein